MKWNGELEPEEGRRARKLLKLHHPTADNPERFTPEQLVRAGMRMAFNRPAWLDLVSTIPRKRPSRVYLVAMEIGR